MGTTTVTLPPRASAALGNSRLSLAAGLRALAGNYLVGRIVKAIFTIWLVITLTFFLIRLMPGNPMDQYIQQLIAQYSIPYVEARDQAAALFGINPKEPLVTQYVRYMGQLVHGDLGNSLAVRGTPVTSIILGYLPWTLFSVGMGLLISFLLGILLGMVMAYRRESPLDHTLSILGSLLHSIPNYLFAIVLIAFLGVQMQLLPVTKMRGSLSPGVQPTFTLFFLKDAFFHASLPIATYVVGTLGSWMLTMKASTVSTLGEDFVAFGKAKGLGDGRLTSAYVGRNAVLPLFTQLTLSMGFIFGGSVAIEAIYVYRGIGSILQQAVNARDYTVMQGVFLLITIAVVVANLLTDLLYSRIDPRIRLQGND